MWSLLAVALVMASLADAAVRTDGDWRGKAQSLEQSSSDKGPSLIRTPAQWLLPPRRAPPPYVEASFFRKTGVAVQEPARSTLPSIPTNTDATTTTTTTTTPAPEPDAEVLVLPARFPPVWRPSLLGEDLVGSLLRHTATEEFERSHGQYVDSFIHGQPLGFF